MNDLRGILDVGLASLGPPYPGHPRQIPSPDPVLPQLLQHARHVGRQRGLDLHRRAAGRMEETEPPRVQGLAIQQHQFVRRIAADLAPRDLRPAAVLAIAQHRAADVAQMDADLVRAAGLRKDADDGETVEPLADFVERLRGAARRVVAADGHLLPLLRMHADGAVDEIAVAVRPAGDDREILLLDRAVLELEGQFVVRPVVAGDEDDAAGVAVEAMDDPRPQLAAACCSTRVRNGIAARRPRCRTNAPGPDGRPFPAAC